MVKTKDCYACGKRALSKDEVGLTKKLVSRQTDRYYCLNCLADNLEIDIEFLLDKIQDFKDQGCVLF